MKATKEKAKKAGSSRQVSWQEKTQKAGGCVRCGKGRGRSPYGTTCIPCANKRRIEQRKYRKTGVWRKGGPGRPPKTLAKKAR